MERMLRRGLLNEELEEFEEASEPAELVAGTRKQKRQIAAVARELADVVYVAYGSALHYGIDLDAVIAEVHRANMEKMAAGATMRRDGKVLKPDAGWTPPDIESILYP